MYSFTPMRIRNTKYGLMYINKDPLYSAYSESKLLWIVGNYPR